MFLGDGAATNKTGHAIPDKAGYAMGDALFCSIIKVPSLIFF
jgi:hypothetical protein